MKARENLNERNEEERGRERYNNSNNNNEIDHGIAETRMDMGAMEEIIMNATDAENLVTNRLNVLTK